MGSPMPYSYTQQVMDEIEEMVPFYHHFADADVNKMGLDKSEVNGNAPATRRLYKGLFPSGFGRFTPVEYNPPKDNTSKSHPLMLMVGSNRYHFGTGSRSSRSARLKQFSPEAFLEISPADAKDNCISNGDRVKIISAQGELSTSARINDVLPRGLLFMPVSFTTSPVHELFGIEIDRQTKAPGLKSCAVRLERTTGND
jgi:predicted molibdopterin-dependent oxidoreductase YjgC